MTPPEASTRIRNVLGGSGLPYQGQALLMAYTWQRSARCLLVVLVGGTLAGCGAGRSAEPGESGFLHGAGGVNTSVADVLLRDVSIDEPGDTAYQPGDVARLRLTLFNEAPQSDALVRVSTPAASVSRIVVDSDCDGIAEIVGEVPLPPQPALRTPAPSRPDGPEIDYLVELQLDQKVPSGTFVPVTFTFRQAGTTTVQVPVELTNSGDRDTAACEPTA